MRQYVVRAGDSPAKIAIAFAGCPKCVESLVRNNPARPTVRYPNGFTTFQSLHIGDVLNLPDEWFDGRLDALPQEYFDALPMMPTQSAGVGGRPEGPVVIHTDKAPPPWHELPLPPPPPLPQPGDPPGLDAPLIRGYTQPANNPLSASTCQQVYGVTVNIGQPILSAPNPNVSGAAMSYAANTPIPPTGTSAWINGRLYVFRPVPSPSPTYASSQIAIYYCAPTMTARHGGYGVAGPGTPPGPGIPIPSTANPGMPSGQTFFPQEEYTLTVWPIPSGSQPQPDPVQVLTDLHFAVQNSTDNIDGSTTVDTIFIGANAYTVDPNAGIGTLIITDYAPSHFSVGETIVGDSSGATAVVMNEYDATGSQDGVLTLSSVAKGASTGNFFYPPETIRGLTSGALATIKYEYGNVMASVSGMVGLSSAVNAGQVLAQLPYDVQSTESVVLSVQPIMDVNGNLADPTAIFADYGFTATAAAVQNPADCSWTLSGTNTTPSPITLGQILNDLSTNAQMLVKGLTVNGSVIVQPDAPLGPIPSPTMTACHAFSLSFIPTACPPVTGGAYDPTVGLSLLGLTNFTLEPSGPDVLGQYTVDGVWELGDGFTLPQSPNLTITGFTDNGQAQNVPAGVCATGLPFTIQPGDSINAIVRPVAVPGQPMTNPVAVLDALGFVNVAPASTYSDCTWVMTADYPAGAPPLQIADPLVSAGVGAMWVVGLSVNSTVIKPANWIQLAAQTPTLQQCHAYTVFFTYATCPALTGAPGDWDPTPTIATLLPGFKIAPGPNEYGEWSASGTWTGATVAALAGTSGVTFTFLVDYGVTSGCTVTPAPCAAGTIADSVTGACVTPCSDGSAPASGVCPPVVPVKGTGPAPVVAPAATTSTGTVVAVGAGALLLGGLAYFALK
jgi:hypothetical protein